MIPTSYCSRQGVQQLGIGQRNRGARSANLETGFSSACSSSAEKNADPSYDLVLIFCSLRPYAFSAISKTRTSTRTVSVSSAEQTSCRRTSGRKNESYDKDELEEVAGRSADGLPPEFRLLQDGLRTVRVLLAEGLIAGVPVPRGEKNTYRTRSSLR